MVTGSRHLIIILSLTLMFSFNFIRSQEIASSPLKNFTVSNFQKSCEKDLEQATQTFRSLENYPGPYTVDAVLVPYNDLWIQIDRSLNLASLFQSAHPDSEMRAVSEKLEQEFSKLITEINLSKSLYETLSKVKVAKEDVKTARFLNKTLVEFRRAGVDRDDATREKVRKLQEELVTIRQEFGKNIREDVRFILLDSPQELAGLPEDYIVAHQPGEDGKIKITTDYPDYIPFMTYAESDKRRLELYKKYRRRGYPKNEKVLSQLLEKRYQLARELGYQDYAQYITEDKMIKTPESVQDFIDKVSQVATKRAEQDYRELLSRLHQDVPEVKEVGDWQKSYLEELVKREKYAFDSQELRPYFQYDRVKQGLLDLTSKMYQVHYKKSNIPVWDESVEAYEIWSGDQLIGRFYLDMHPRQNKFKHAAMGQVVTGISGVQVPEAVLLCNFPGGDGSLGLMEHEQVSTFFHEFGHLLHHIFAGNQPWIGISGLSTEWDFVETPSILFEEWTWDGDILKTFAVNDAGETIPDELIRKMNRSRRFQEGLNVKQQMFYAAISLNFYNRPATTFQPLDLVKELQKKYTPFSYVGDTYMYLAFGHLDDYSAVYCTYMWSEVIAKDLFSAFKKGGLENSEIAMKYRRTILEPGGSKDAAQLVKDFLGREYSFEAYRNWLEGEDI